MDAKLLLKLIQKDWTLGQIATYCRCSISNVRYWLTKYSLKTNHKKGNVKNYYKCNSCGETNKNKMRLMKKGLWSHCICAKCHNLRKKAQSRFTKLQAIHYKGGKCIICGYNKCPGAMDFHHRNPDEKDLQWNNQRHRKFEALKSELDKCDLLCKNCHATLHYEQDEQENFNEIGKVWMESSQ